MKQHIFPLPAILALLFASPNADAVILYGKDNTGNTTAPPSGAPWENVAHIGNLSGTGVGSSAVYLGSRWMLTANHVAQRSSVSFDGVNSWLVDSNSWQQVDSADLKVFRLQDDPGLSGLMLYEDAVAGDDFNETSTIVGWGVGRDPTTPPETDQVPWGDNTTRDKRWGTNTTDGLTVTVNGTDSLLTFLDNNVGDDEGAVTFHDSGGALFQFIDGAWHLSGISIAVGAQEENHSTFGAPIMTGQIQTGHTGDENYFARMATYSDSINAIIPEPSTWSLLIGVGIFGSVLLRRRRS